LAVTAFEVHGLTTTRAEGDFGIERPADELAGRRRALVDRPWAWVRQVHGADVVVVTRDTIDEVCGAPADALVTNEPDLVLAIQTADCAPVRFDSPQGIIGVAHAGWGGLEQGVLERTVGTMVELGATDIAARLGPCIHVECYEFGAIDLDRLASQFGDEVRGRTTRGTDGFDLPRAVRVASAALGVSLVDESTCTACGATTYFSHRARAEPQRMATVAWTTRAVPAG
jgi:YfiH family protein